MTSFLFYTITIIIATAFVVYGAAKLHQEISDIKRRIAALETAEANKKPKCHPNKDLVNQEEAIALLLGASQDYDTACAFLQQSQRRTDKANEILRILRGDNHHERKQQS